MTTNNHWLNSTYLLIGEERREKQRRERQNKNWRAKSEEDSCGKIYAAPGDLFTYSWSWQSFNLLFALDLQKEIQRLSRLFCYSWLACLLGFWLRNALPDKKKALSEIIVLKNKLLFIVLRLTGCVRGLKFLQRCWPYLMAFKSCISTGKLELL